jgi:hypothetical protein
MLMSDIEMTDVASRGVSRRAMIAGTAGTAAAMWAAPAIMSLGAGAGAASSVCAGGEWNCGEPPNLCGTGSNGQDCLCDVDTDDRAFCWEDFPCVGAVVCANNNDCPAGQACTTNCCGTTCAPVCGHPAGQAALSGKSGSGKVY